MGKVRKTTAGGFTIVELLVVVATLAVIVGIAIPRLLNAANRSRQKETMAEMRDLATALHVYHVDHNAFPPGTDITGLGGYLEPYYMQKIPVRDAWGHTMIYASTGQSYTIGSLGREGTAPLSLIGTGGARHNMDDDIVYSDGQFIQWPEGFQQD